jgi:lipoprotein-releasing system permease protein
LNLPLFIAKRITFNSNRTFSKLIVRIAILGIMLGLAVMILAIAIVKGFKSEIREKVRGFSGDIQVSKLDLNTSYENTSFSISDSSLQKILKQEGVEFVQSFATKPGIINTNEEVEGVVLKGCWQRL